MDFQCRQTHPSTTTTCKAMDLAFNSPKPYKPEGLACPPTPHGTKPSASFDGKNIVVPLFPPSTNPEGVMPTRKIPIEDFPALPFYEEALPQSPSETKPRSSSDPSKLR